MSEYKVASVIGLSLLREKEPATNTSVSLDNKRAQYLSKYKSGDDDDDAAAAAAHSKKKKKKKRKAAQMASVHVVDEDVGWPADVAVGKISNQGDGADEDDEEEGVPLPRTFLVVTRALSNLN
jgi:hypothetical protein